MIVFVLRHADRTTVGDDLTPAGRVRAKVLAMMLADSGLGFAFRSQAARAKKTLVPLKAKLPSLLIKEVRMENTETEDAYGKKLADAVRALPANTVVAVIGHSNTVGPTIKHLGGGLVDSIGDSEFDKLFVLVSTPTAPTNLIKLRYGEPT